MMKRFLGLLLILWVIGGNAADSTCSDCPHECTSWMYFHELTQNRTNVVHKNRDASSRKLMPLKSAEGAARQWIGLGDRSLKNPNQIAVCMGLNASGLAIAVNSGEKTAECSDAKADLGTPAIIEICLAECDTAAQAVQKLEAIRSARRYKHGKSGSIFFFMDLQEAFIVEMTAERCTVQRYERSYAYRANTWHNPDMAAVADNSIEGWMSCANREFMVIRGLNRAWRTNQKITVADAVAMSRDTASPSQTEPSTICSKYTNSASTLEINLDYPDVLSTGYFLIGPPRHTICVPFPVGVERFHPRMTDFSWVNAAWKRFDAQGFDAEFPAAWQEFEARTMAEYCEAQAKAEKLLKAGKRAEAKQLLNDCAYAIWDKAAKLLNLPEN